MSRIMSDVHPYFDITQKELDDANASAEKALEASGLMSHAELEKLPTKRLLAYYKKKRSSRYNGWYGECGDYHNIDDEALGIVFNRYFDDIKTILDSREHV